MLLFYSTCIILLTTIGYSIYENKKNNLISMIQEKQLEFGNSIIEKRRRSFGKYGIAVSIIALMVITPFAFSNKNCGDSIYCYNNDLFQVVEVSAGEYIINSYGEGFSFGINVFVENESILLLDDQYPYYEGFQKYHTVNEIVDLVSYNIDGGIYTEVTIDDSYNEYILVEADELNVITRVFNFEFENFEEDIYRLNNLLSEYPPITVRKYLDNGDYWDTERMNDNYQNIESEYDSRMYQMYFDSIVSKATDYEEADMRRVEINFIADGSLENFGEFTRFGTAYYTIDKVQSKEQVELMQYNNLFSNNPFWTLESGGQATLDASYNYLDGEVQKYPGKAYMNIDKYEEYADIYSTILFDISNLDESLPEIDVQGTIRGIVSHDTKTEEGYPIVKEDYSITHEISNYYIVENLLVIPPLKVITVYKDGSTDFMFDYDVTVIINGEEIIINSGTGSNVWFD